MRTESPQDRGQTKRLRHLLLGGAVPAGWALHDLAVFLTSGEPRVALDLLPGWAAFIVAGALLSAGLSSAPRVLVVGLLLAGCVPLPEEWALSAAQRQLPAVLVTLGLAVILANWISARSALSAVRAGLCVGALACSVWTWLGAGIDASLATACVLAGSVIGLGLGRLRAAPRRRVATLALLAACASPVGWIAREDARLARADRYRSDVEAPERAGSQPPNLILVVMDTVRADHLASYGYGRQTMPHLERFMAEQGIRFEQARSSSSWTLPSHASLLTGLMPGEHGATHPRDEAAAIVGVGAWEAVPIHEHVRTLAERLGGVGFRTGAIVSNAYYLNHGYGLDRGFEHYDDRHGSWVRGYLALPQYAGVALRAGRLLYRDAEEITGLALRWVVERPQGRPFFLFLNYMDAHAPYLPPGASRLALESSRPIDPLRLTEGEVHLEYDRELHFLDTQLDRLIRGIDQRGLLRDSVLIVTSDHGEDLGDHGFQKHGWTLYDSVVRVPLFLKPAGDRQGPSVDHEPISGAQVHDLALSALQLEELSVGTSAAVSGEWFQVPDPARAAVLGKGDLARDLVSWLEFPRKFIVTSKGEVQAFDVQADPKEATPLALSEAERTLARAKAWKWWSDHPAARSRDAPSPQGSPELSERLRALGYGGPEAFDE